MPVYETTPGDRYTQAECLLSGKSFTTLGASIIAAGKENWIDDILDHIDNQSVGKRLPALCEKSELLDEAYWKENEALRIHLLNEYKKGQIARAKAVEDHKKQQFIEECAVDEQNRQERAKKREQNRLATLKRKQKKKQQAKQLWKGLGETRRAPMPPAVETPFQKEKREWQERVEQKRQEWADKYELGNIQGNLVGKEYENYLLYHRYIK